MSIRIDLLNASERRYQGPVSGRFIAFASIFLVLSAVLLLSSYIIFSTYLQKKQLDGARDAWESLESRYKNMVAINSSLSKTSDLLEELSGWSRARLDTPVLMTRLQQILPDNIRLTTLSLRDDISEPADSAADDDQMAAFRLCRMGMSGVSQGDSSESAVIKLIGDIRSIGGTNSYFETVTLNSMQREDAPISARSFSIGAEGGKREL